MKRYLLIVLCVSMFLFHGCGKEGNTDVMENKQVIIFTNEVETADIWILPQTEEILKTSLWGKATISDMKKGESTELSLNDLGGPGIYVIRIIDEDGGYFAMNDVPLDEDYSISFLTEDHHLDAWIEIRNADGEILKSEPVFEGMLGAN